MTYAQFKEHLGLLSMFTEAEVHWISRAVGKYTLGNAIAACQLGNIELSGSDIDEMIAHFSL